MATWLSIAFDHLWRNAFAAVPLILVVALVLRWVRCRPATRHGLWLMVLVWLVCPPLLPGLTASNPPSGGLDAPSGRTPNDGELPPPALDDSRSLSTHIADVAVDEWPFVPTANPTDQPNGEGAVATIVRPGHSLRLERPFFNQWEPSLTQGGLRNRLVMRQHGGHLLRVPKEVRRHRRRATPPTRTPSPRPARHRLNGPKQSLRRPDLR